MGGTATLSTKPHRLRSTPPIPHLPPDQIPLFARQLPLVFTPKTHPSGEKEIQEQDIHYGRNIFPMSFNPAANRPLHEYRYPLSWVESKSGFAKLLLTPSTAGARHFLTVPANNHMHQFQGENAGQRTSITNFQVPQSKRSNCHARRQHRRRRQSNTLLDDTLGNFGSIISQPRSKPQGMWYPLSLSATRF